MFGRIIAPLAGVLSLAATYSCSTMSSTERQLDRVAFEESPDIPLFDADAPAKPVSLARSFSPNTLIITYDPEIGTHQLLKAAKKQGAEVVYEYSVINAIVVRISDKADLIESAKRFAKVEGVVKVSRDYINHLD